jgi:hypothetical protein
MALQKLEGVFDAIRFGAYLTTSEVNFFQCLVFKTWIWNRARICIEPKMLDPDPH